MRLPFSTDPTGNMFQCNTDENFKEISNVFGIADEILTVGHDADGKDHERMLRQVILICCKEILILKEDKCHFRCTRVPFVYNQTLIKLTVLLICHSLLTKELQSFFRIMNYLSKFSSGIIKGRLEMEKHVPKAIQKSNGYHQEGCMHEILQWEMNHYTWKH